MNPTHVYPISVELHAVRYMPNEAPLSQLYAVHAQVTKNGTPHEIVGIHVSEHLVPFFLADDVSEFVHETLEFGSAAFYALPNGPTHVLTSLKTRAGHWHHAELPAFLRTRRMWLAGGVCGLVVGVAALIANATAWVPAVACVIGSHCWRTAMRVPNPAGFSEVERLQ